MNHKLWIFCPELKANLLRWKIYPQISTWEDDTICFSQYLIKMSQSLLQFTDKRCSSKSINHTPQQSWTTAFICNTVQKDLKFLTSIFSIFAKICVCLRSPNLERNSRACQITNSKISLQCIEENKNKENDLLNQQHCTSTILHI